MNVAKPRHWGVRFSLRTLVLCALFAGSCGGLWWRWDPWVCTDVLQSPLPNAHRASFLPDGRHVVVTDWSSRSRAWGPDPVCSAQVWDLESGRVSLSLSDYPDRSFPIDMSADERWTVCAGDDNTANVLSTGGGWAPVRLRGHTGRVLWSKFSPDDQRIVTVSEDGTGRIWNAQTGQSLAVFRSPAGHFVCGSFAPEGQRVVTVSSAGEVRIWGQRRWDDIGVVSLPEFWIALVTGGGLVLIGIFNLYRLMRQGHRHEGRATE